MTLILEDSVFWSDSMIVLQYISSTRQRFHTFVVNRLGTIHRASSPNQWHHVRSEDNPADDATRGLSAQELIKGGRWKFGPSFLRYEKDWPPKLVISEASNHDPEIRKQDHLLATTVEDQNPTDKLLEHYSSWYELQRAVAWFRRFVKWNKEGCYPHPQCLSVTEFIIQETPY
ncbi:uncharacterized protein LOC122258664 [Penaeus japonicus]|uniref:uncharacterized protein LOC122258664 n=1 Tax=Penaeus japonicus TaxID=27405 RepID=UPI001C716201|nr:uncharacterized protein LOC122258664 [Penaeus japonicus]